MQKNPTLPVIHRAEEIPTSGDYQHLYEQGLQWISQYSGDLWNNYNLGDPGVTILQTLCYALTELSYKTSFPVEDILTRENGKIDYDNRFVKPQDILPTSPVSLLDFKKKLIDEVVELKQIYFNLENDNIVNTFIPYLELKPTYVGTDLSFSNNIKAKVDQVLLDYQNVGNLFLPSSLLHACPLVLEGIINLEPSINIEQFIAALIFELNNDLSPYPIFDSYDNLLKQGKTNDQIFDGPLLKSGFLDDDNFKSKKKDIKLRDLTMLINGVEGVAFVSDINLKRFLYNENLKEEQEGIPIPVLDAFYFNFKSVIHADLNIIQNGRPVDFISEDKVDYYLEKLIPKPLRPTDFDAYLPKGTFRELGTYYSIQHHFPEIYELNKKYRNENIDPIRIAKNKQLKAYLGLFEQIMANYLAQLDHVGDLFSFESGRNLYQLAGKTYFFQDLYDVPEIQSILKDVKGYDRKSLPETNAADWDAYKRDNLNPYRQVLMAAVESPETNLVRKNNVLRHLLARFGDKYQPQYFNLTNPNYGNEETAEVVHISEILKQFPLISANRGRSYFLPGECENTLYAGFELQADKLLNLNAYYQGVIEIINEALDSSPDAITVFYYNEKGIHRVFGKDQIIREESFKSNSIEIYYHKKRILNFLVEDDIIDILTVEEALPINKVLLIQTIKFLLDPYQYTLEQLMKQSKGFVFIDNIRLLQNFTFTLKILEDTTSCPIIMFKELDVSQAQSIIAFVRRVLQYDYNDFINSEGNLPEMWIKVFSEDPSKSKQVFDHLRKAKESDGIKFKLNVSNTIGYESEIPIRFLESTVTAVFPKWISLLQEPQFKKEMRKQLQSVLPMNVQLFTCYASQSEMDDLLAFFNCWMGEIIAAKEKNTMRCLQKYKGEESWGILQILNKIKQPI